MSERPSIAARACILLVRAYQVTLSPIVGRQCRFHPTCSHYAIEALRAHGAWRGSVLAAGRVLRCHPFHAGGYDPPPPRDAEAARREGPSAEDGAKVGCR